MEKLIILRYGELYLKGKNRGWFEKVLINNIKNALHGVKYAFEKTQGRYLVSGYAAADESVLIERLKKIAGLHSLSIAYKIPTDWEEIVKTCVSLAPAKGTFKVDCNRADKTFKYKTPYIAAEIGYHVLQSNPGLSVDVHTPESVINLDIRENGSTYIYSEKFPCIGGLPVGVSGNGMVLLSGGIDSPVAAYKMLKRGLNIRAVHFESYPYTSISAQEKAVDLAKRLKGHAGNIDLYMVPFKEIQDEIHKNCAEAYMITIMRRFMMRIAEVLAKKHNCGCLITGESLGQVASQTVPGITVSNAVLESLPVLRPLIGCDKEEIMREARFIGTYDISIRPYDDCCTVFLPENPVIAPDTETAAGCEAKLDIDGLVSRAVANVKLIKI